jgi:hypothetical protein
LNGSLVPPVPRTTIVPKLENPAKAALLHTDAFDLCKEKLERLPANPSGFDEHASIGDSELGISDTQPRRERFERSDKPQKDAEERTNTNPRREDDKNQADEQPKYRAEIDDGMQSRFIDDFLTR